MSERNQGRSSSITVPPPEPRDFASVLDRNIRTLQTRRDAEAAEASLQERVAQAVTRFSGSMAFVYIHLVVFGLWIAWNAGWVHGLTPWDPSFVSLATAASVEAIFLSTFVLISQNRSAKAADQRADLDLQINLLAEHEVTRVLTLTRAIAEQLGVNLAEMPEIAELQRDVAPEAVLDKLEGEEEPGERG